MLISIYKQAYISTLSIKCFFSGIFDKVIKIQIGQHINKKDQIRRENKKRYDISNIQTNILLRLNRSAVFRDCLYTAIPAGLF